MMGKTRIALLALVVLVASGVTARKMQTLLKSTPKKPLWPVAFQGPFGLNDKLFGYHNRSSFFYYNWSYAQSTRIHYPLGCMPLITTKPCDLIFTANDTYLLAPKDDKPCCHLFSVGSLPPNFLRGFTYDDVDKAPDMSGTERTCDHWKGPDAFAYWTDQNTGEDIQFKDSFTGSYWNWGPLQVPNQINNSLFDIPSGCKSSCIFDHDDEATKERLRNLTPDMLGPYFRRPKNGF